MGGQQLLFRPDAPRRLQRATLTSVRESRVGRRVLARGGGAPPRPNATRGDCRSSQVKRTENFQTFFDGCAALPAEVGVTDAGKSTDLGFENRVD